eukprot:CAMPEP_0178467682 /NCGR_PEP_ID=MMETSP0689_2-20121128/52538_1 /TAXON_ID=160604 /ORGANISM="Amphidinium massartii, Strain CS-259" /LENGTH=180 /DNA_ID=CAMNT_0020094731 /DNA_START=608 /DNA_END=1151 /DNA_ORIENTATION=-
MISNSSSSAAASSSSPESTSRSMSLSLASAAAASEGISVPLGLKLERSPRATRLSMLPAFFGADDASINAGLLGLEPELLSNASLDNLSRTCSAGFSASSRGLMSVTATASNFMTTSLSTPGWSSSAFTGFGEVSISPLIIAALEKQDDQQSPMPDCRQPMIFVWLLFHLGDLLHRNEGD